MSILVWGKAELFRHWNGSKTLDEPKTEKNYSTQHADAKRQMKAGHALLAETKGSKFKEGHAANCRGNHGSAVFPQEHSRERCTPGVHQVHQVHQVGGGGHPLAHLYLHHPVLRDTGAQTLNWRLRLVACHRVMKMKNQFFQNLQVNFRQNLKTLDRKINFYDFLKIIVIYRSTEFIDLIKMLLQEV